MVCGFYKSEHIYKRELGSECGLQTSRLLADEGSVKHSGQYPPAESGFNFTTRRLGGIIFYPRFYCNYTLPVGNTFSVPREVFCFGGFMKKTLLSAIAAAIGFANGFFGSGGGVIAVPALCLAGLETKKAHATSISLILPISAASIFFYLQKGNFEWKTALLLALPGLCGAAAGCFLIKKIPSIMLKRIFGILLIISGIRVLLS